MTEDKLTVAEPTGIMLQGDPAQLLQLVHERNKVLALLRKTAIELTTPNDWQVFGGSTG